MKVLSALGYVALFFVLGAPILIGLVGAVVTGNTYYISTSQAEHTGYGKAYLSDWVIYGCIFEAPWLMVALYVVLHFVPSACKPPEKYR